MTKEILFGVNNTSKKIIKAYFGVGNSSKKVKKVYFGDENRKARLAWTSSVPAGQVIFTVSQIWTVPDGVSIVDVFLVGGGGCGGNYSSEANTGAGGGYTIAHYNVNVVPLSQQSIVVGAGGVAISNGISDITRGGDSSAFGLSIGGGYGGGIKSNHNNCGNGGSGGGNVAYSMNNYAGMGGADGTNGYEAYDYSTGNGGKVSIDTAYLTGQGYNTRAFDEATGTIYSGGGGGGCGYKGGSFGRQNGGAGGGGNGGYYSEPGSSWHPYIEPMGGTPNTGGGAGGGRYMNVSSIPHGGSGIVIVRWLEQ